ncbi:hypothetical protein, partial [Mesorhizobium sp. M7A.F.Ca.CA.001.11.2.1]
VIGSKRGAELVEYVRQFLARGLVEHQVSSREIQIVMVMAPTGLPPDDQVSSEMAALVTPHHSFQRFQWFIRKMGSPGGFAIARAPETTVPFVNAAPVAQS